MFPNFINDYSIGNIITDKFYDCWNGEKSKLLRKSILNKSFEYCNFDICGFEYADYSDIYQEIMPYPKYIKYGLTSLCNFNCQMCYRHNEDNNQKLYIEKSEQILNDKIFKEKILPILSNCEEFGIATSGEAFYSKHYFDVIKIVRDTYPNIKFRFHTNGSLCSEKMIKYLKIENRILEVAISLHATTKETHEKITRTKTFNKIIKNIEYLATLKNNNIINDLTLLFVVQKDNYKEIPLFIDMCKKYNTECSFWAVRNWFYKGNPYYESYKDMAVHLKEHPEYGEFVKILNTEIVKNNKNCFTNELKKLID